MYRANCDKQRGKCAMRADSRSISQAGMTRPLILAGVASALLHLAILGGLLNRQASSEDKDAAAQLAALQVSLNSTPSGLPPAPSAPSPEPQQLQKLFYMK